MTTARKLSQFLPLLLVLAALPNLNAQTTVTLTGPTSPVTFGASVTLSVAVTPATATGKVTFYDGVTVLGTKPLTSGAASISTILLTAGSHTKIKAYYAGDSSNAAATSNAISLTVTANFSAGFVIRNPLGTAATAVLAVADFNGDNKADIVVRNASGLTVLLGDGAGNFGTPFNFTPTGATPILAAVGDFNGDGKADLAVASSTSSNVIVLLGNGDGTFQTPASFPVPNSLTGLAVADFNGDGKADIATADPTSGVNILLGKGDGTFQAAVPYIVNPATGTGNQAAVVVVGDFNGDGKADLATVNMGSSNLSILLGVGDGTFQPPVLYSTPTQALQLAVGDFNGDGKADLATNNANILLGKGDGTFPTLVTYVTGSTPSSVATGDFNGDGNLDLAFSDGAVIVLSGKGDGTFLPPATYTVGSGATSVVVSDFNSDGRTDIAVASGGNLSLLLGTTLSITPTAGTPQSTAINTAFPTALQVVVKSGGTPASGVTVTFAAPTTGASAALSSSTAVTDANGLASVAATANSASGSYTVTATALGVTTSFSLTNLSGAASTITASPTLPQSTLLGTAFARPLQVTLTDSTGLPASGVTVSFTAPTTGASAVLSAATAVTNASGVASVTATANNIAGSYTVKATAGTLSTSFSLSNVQTLTVTLASSSNPSNLGPPLTLTSTVATSSTTGKLTFFDGVSILGTKPVTGGIVSLSTILLSPGTHKLTAYYRDDANGIVGTSSVLTQAVKAAAGGAFITEPPISAKPNSSNVALGDFDGNGLMDVAFPNVANGSGSVTVLLGKGDGTFQPAVSYAAGGTGAASAIAAGDFNGDGNTDLAVATFTPVSSPAGIVNVSILLGNGDGTFRTAVSYPTGGMISITAMAVGDFNSDGKADLLLSYSFATSSTVSMGSILLVGNGDGTFAAPIAYSTLGGPFVVADFNGDGKPDVALATSVAGALNNTNPFILLGNGDGTAQTPIAFSLGVTASISSLVAGDFNGDGKTDLAVGGLLSGAPVTWILLGNGNGTFQTAVSYTLGAAVASGDFNGDGFLDLVVADVNGNTAGILQGKGDGTFQTGPALTGGATLAVTDFNNDGKNDLFTANSTAGTVSVLLGATSVSFAVTATGGGNQSAPVGNSFAVPLQVTVLNNGIPLNGATVTFTAPTTGATATLSSPTAVTNTSGVASVTATANFTAGSYMVTATYQNQSATFSLTNTTFAFITATGGTPQSAIVGGPFATALQVTVKDGLGNPVPSVSVTFAAPPTGASATLSSATATTNSSGVATVSAVANTIAGSYVVTATVGNLTAMFALTNTAGAAASIAATGGTPQSTILGAAFATALQATVKDSNGNLVPGVTVTFAAPPTGPSATLSSQTAVTNASGVASVTATANSIAGAYTVTANVASLVATFALTNTGAGGVTATGGTPQVTLIGTAFATALQVTVKDSGGNPLNGVTVTFAAPTSGASAVLSSGTAVTNASGVASVTATANSVAGSYLVTATVGTLSASFSLTNTSGVAASLTATGGTLQSSLLDQAFPNPLQVTVKDANGLPVVSATVTFSAPLLGASATLSSGTALTNASGVASVTATANNIAGTYTVTATLGSMTASFSLTNLFGGNSDLALGRTATQSSTLPGYPSAVAGSAVDGNTDGSFFDNSVTATNQDVNAWWQVDLGASASISSVVVWNRTDCCAARLSDFWVFVSNTPFLATDTPATLQNRAGTFASHQTTSPSPSVTIAVNGAQGQYVRVQLSNTDYLSLAEVQVMGTGGGPVPTNLALTKPASQSSTLPGYPTAVASSANDGNTDGNFNDGSVTATNADASAWWQVDLGASSTVNSVVIWNRTDCCNTRLSDFWVFVSDTPFLATDTPATLQNRAGTFASHQTITPNPSSSITIGAQGRYVRVQLTGTGYLSLAEVQVIGIGPSVANLAVGKFATQSSTFPGSVKGATAAVDGNTDGNYLDNSVTATNADANAWWQVDLGASATVSSVTIWNRTDCCGGRLSDYWVFVSNTPFLATDTPATLMNRAGTFASHQTTAPNASTSIPVNAPGQYVRVQLSDTDYLSLAEVQVFGTGGSAGASNVALGKTATQSSNFYTTAAALAPLAVDGNVDGNFFDGSVTATGLDPNPWWQVDLGSTFTVSSIAIWNRTDCCGTRLGDYWVFVSNTPFLASDTPTTLQNRAGTFAIHQTTAPNPSTTLTLGSAQGRYVRVQLSTAGYLSLAEVQVFGQ